MGVMTKLRERAGGFLVVLLAFSFGGLWMLMDTGVFDTMGAGGRSGNIIVIDGEPITVDAFNQAVEQQIRVYEAQTGRQASMQVREQAREQAYQALVGNHLRETAMDRLGITVTGDELYSMVLGPNPHPVIRTYFGDSTGQVNRQLLLSFINNPDARQEWLQLENYLRAQRRQEKLSTLLAATVHVSEQDVLSTYRQQRQTVDVQYVALPYAAVPSDSIEITESDLRAFYEAHREEYQRERTYTLTYAAIPKTATAQDTALVREDLERLRAEFAEAENDSLFLARNLSEQPYTGAYFTADELNPQIAEAVFEDPEAGRVIGPVFTGGVAHLIKIQDVREAEAGQEVQLADYALGLRPSVATLNEAQETLGDLAYFAGQSGSFAEETRSRDLQPQQVQVQAGQRVIPGLGPSTAVMRFLEDADEGGISEVIETDGQFVVVHVDEIQPEGYYPLAEVQDQIRARVERQKKLAVQRRRLERALEAGSLEETAQAVGAQLRTAPDLALGAGAAAPVVGSDPAFMGTAMGLDEGETSRVVTGQNAVFVLRVTGVDEPPAITEAERSQLRQQLERRRQAEVTRSWLTALREEADIEDNRAQYLQ